MRKVLTTTAIVLLLMACRSDGETPAAPRLTTDVMLRTTPVKNQGSSQLCWIYAMLATIETEHLMQGDSVNLSIDYLAAAFLRQQALQRYADPQRAITTRGILPMTVGLLQRYGCEPFDNLRNDGVDHEAVGRTLLTMADDRRTRRMGYSSLAADIDSELERAYGPIPRFVFMYSCEYTPIEFAHSLCRSGEYVAVTSVAHHPYGAAVDLELPDNMFHDRFLNLPVDSLMALTDRSLAQGHPVAWEGDISEQGFDWERGLADIDSPEGDLQAIRQRMIDRADTTDDHCMAIVGTAHDADGHRYYILKNSWGTGNATHGLIYMSARYFALKTIALMVNSAIEM